MINSGMALWLWKARKAGALMHVEPEEEAEARH